MGHMRNPTLLAMVSLFEASTYISPASNTCKLLVQLVRRCHDSRRQSTVHLFTGTLLPVLPTIVQQLPKQCVSATLRSRL